ncbi:hypothetical protein ACTL6U_07360 [Rhodovibrionaceae bacterium A322]
MLLRPSLAVTPDLSSWSYESYLRETPSFQFDIFTSLVSLWRSKKQDRALPAWRDFDPTDLRSWMGAIAIWQNGQLPQPQITNRLFGHKAGADPLDPHPAASDLPAVSDHDRAREANYLSLLVEQGLLGRERGTLHLSDGALKKVEILSLPFADDGQTVSHLLSVHTFSDPASAQEAVNWPRLPQLPAAGDDLADHLSL